MTRLLESLPCPLTHEVLQGFKLCFRDARNARHPARHKTSFTDDRREDKGVRFIFLNRLS